MLHVSLVLIGQRGAAALACLHSSHLKLKRALYCVWAHQIKISWCTVWKKKKKKKKKLWIRGIKRTVSCFFLKTYWNHMLWLSLMWHRKALLMSSHNMFQGEIRKRKRAMLFGWKNVPCLELLTESLRFMYLNWPGHTAGVLANQSVFCSVI